MRATGLSRSRPGSTVTRSPPCGRRSADAARPLTRTLGRVDAVAEHSVVDGEQITRRRLHLSRRRAWATVRPAGTGSERPSTATGLAEPCSSSPASAAATAAASSHSSSHARGVSRSQADQGEGVPTRTRAARVAVDPGSSRWRLQPTTLWQRLGQSAPTYNEWYLPANPPPSRREHGVMRSAPHGSPGPWQRHR
jgi:hypothetical protein